MQKSVLVDIYDIYWLTKGMYTHLNMRDKSKPFQQQSYRDGIDWIPLISISCQLIVDLLLKVACIPVSSLLSML